MQELKMTNLSISIVSFIIGGIQAVISTAFNFNTFQEVITLGMLIILMIGNYEFTKGKSNKEVKNAKTKN